MSLTDEAYVRTQGWREASLAACPNHPAGGCGLRRHGTYRRKTRYGYAHIARWYCGASHMTFSLLPDCFAAGLPGTLDEMEAAVLSVETAPDLGTAAALARPRHVGEPAGARRWLRRRQRLVASCLMTALTLLPDLFAGCEPDIRSMRAALDTGHLLVALRACCDAHLPVMARPVGFAVRTVATSDPLPVPQHALGRDPPGGGSQGSVILQTRRESTLMRTDLEEHRTNIALFRHSIVAPLQFLTGAALAAAIRTLAARSWVIPGSRRTAIAGQTLRDWLRAYRARGFEGLKPKPRADQGKPRRMPVEVAEALIAHRQGNPAQSVRDAIAALRDAGSIPRTSPVSTAAVYRLFHREGLMDKPAPAAQDHRRYAWPDANALWQSDVMHGPKCDDGRGRRRKTYMIAFLDDASRVVPWSAFALSENTADFLTVFKQALMRRGRPKRLFATVDVPLAIIESVAVAALSTRAQTGDQDTAEALSGPRRVEDGTVEALVDLARSGVASAAPVPHHQLLTAEEYCTTRGGRAVRSRRRKNAPLMVPCRFWRGAGMYGVELYAAVRLAVVDEGLSHHEAGRRFGSDPHTGSLSSRQHAMLPPPEEFTMLFLAPPDHTRLRALVNKAFTPKAVRQAAIREMWSSPRL